MTAQVSAAGRPSDPHRATRRCLVLISLIWLPFVPLWWMFIGLVSFSIGVGRLQDPPGSSSVVQDAILAVLSAYPVWSAVLLFAAWLLHFGRRPRWAFALTVPVVGVMVLGVGAVVAWISLNMILGLLE